jgi:dephospho-CoA kinase
MLVIGLTGSIGMGKSAIAAMFRARGIAVCDADAEVHKLYAGAAVPLIEAEFPGTTSNGKVDRAQLGTALMSDPSGFKRLEAIVHPLVQRAERDFLHAEAANGAKAAILEIPLLFETGGDKRVDLVVVVSAPPEKQRERVLARPGMTPAKLENLLSRQTSDSEKRARADFIVDTGGTMAQSQAQVDAILAALTDRAASAFAAHWA